MRHVAKRCISTISGLLSAATRRQSSDTSFTWFCNIRRCISTMRALQIVAVVTMQTMDPGALWWASFGRHVRSREPDVRSRSESQMQSLRRMTPTPSLAMGRSESSRVCDLTGPRGIRSVVNHWASVVEGPVSRLTMEVQGGCAQRAPRSLGRGRERRL